MKTPQFRSLALIATSALLLPAVRLAADVAPVHVNRESSRLHVVARDDYKDRGFEKLRGAQVRGADGKDLGRIHDVVLDARTGDVRFVLVSAGGFVGMGGESRLLPVEALIADPKDRGFITRLQRVDWELLPSLDKADIKDGRIFVTSDQRQHLSHLHDQGWATPFDALVENGADPRVQRYVFASALAGKALHADDKKVGKVEDVYVDLGGRHAMAVVQIDPDYIAGAKDEYLVPVGDLQVPAGSDGRVHTTLAAAEFQRAAGITPDPVTRDAGPWARTREHDQRRDAVEARRDLAGRRADVDGPRDGTMNAEVAPTGRPSGYADGTAEGERLTAAARAVRDMWDTDPELKRYNLSAVPDRGRVLLTGTVPTHALSERAERTARHATSRIVFENNIRVDDPSR